MALLAAILDSAVRKSGIDSKLVPLDFLTSKKTGLVTKIKPFTPVLDEIQAIKWLGVAILDAILKSIITKCDVNQKWAEKIPLHQNNGI